MRQNTFFAFLVLVVGVAAFAYQGFTYETWEKAMALQMTTEKINNVLILPIVGVLALIGGIALLILNAEKNFYYREKKAAA